MAKMDSKESMENLLFIKELIEAGELKVVIDRCYPLEQIWSMRIAMLIRDAKKGMWLSLWGIAHDK
jgi:hypothetical protein